MRLEHEYSASALGFSGFEFWTGYFAGEWYRAVQFDWVRGPHCPTARPYRQKGGAIRYKCQHPGRVVS